MSQAKSFMIVALLAILPLGQAAFGQTEFPVPFAADVKVLTPGIAEPRDFAKYYVTETAVRYEYTKMPERQTHAAILDFEAGKQWTLIPDQQTYFTFYLDGVADEDLVHFQPTIGSPCPGTSESDQVGTETVLDREAEKWTCESGAEGVTTHWVDTTLRFPIRTEQPDGRVIELHNIREEDQPAERFEVPEQFTEASSAR